MQHCLDPFNVDNLVKPDNTHYWGKYHCMTGLQFYKFGFSCFTTNKIQHSFFVGQVQYSDPSPNGECSQIKP